MTSFKSMLRKLVHNPILDFSVGIILFVTGLSEALASFTDFSHLKLGVHHGVVVLGLVTMLKSVADLFAGLEFADEGVNVEREKKHE